MAIQDQDRYLVLEQENALLRSRLQACEQSYARLQAAIACDRQNELYQSNPTLSNLRSDCIPEQRLWEATTAATNALLTIANFDAAVNTALQVIGEALDTDRINVIENVDLSSDSAFPGWRSLSYEWNSPGTVSQHTDAEASQGSYGDVPEIFEQLRQGQAISYLIEKAPEPFRSAQRAIGVKSTYLVPICVEGQWWGLLGLDDCRDAKRRSVEELSVLKIAADCIGNAIQRQRSQQALLEAEQARVAELAKANEKLQQRDRLLSVVARLTKDLLETEDIEVAIPAALQAVGEVADMSRVLLYIERLDPATQQLSHCVAYEWTAEGISDYKTVGLDVMHNDDYQVLVQPLYSGKSIWRIIDDLPDVTRQPFEQLDIQSTGVVPVFIEGHYIGCVAFDDCVTPRLWSQQEIDVLTAAAEIIGAALHRKQLVDRLVEERTGVARERATELAKANEALKQTVDVLATEIDLNRFLGHVLKVIADQLDAPLTEYWYHPEPDNIAYVGLTYWQGHILKPEEQPGHVGLSGYPVPPAMIHQESLHHRRGHFIIEDMATSPLHLQIAREYGLDAGAWYQLHGVSSFLNVPLILGDKTIGALVVFFPGDRQFTEQHIKLTYALAQQVTLAIQLTRLAEEAKQAAIAREQEKAAQERAAELAKTNEVLRRTASQLVEQQSLNHFLDHVLLEVAQETGAFTDAVFLYNEQFNLLSMNRAVCDQHIIEINTDPRFELWRAPVSANHNEGWDLVQARGYAWHELEDHGVLGDELWDFSEVWHRQMQHRRVLSVFLQVGNQPLGFMGLCFRNAVQLSTERIELVRALADQAALAIQLTRLAEEAKQTAIAREQEKAAQERVTQLARANTTLKRTLDVLATEPLIDRSLGHVLQVLTEQLESSSSALWLYNVNTHRFSLHLVYLNGDIVPVIPENIDRLSGQWTRDRELPSDLQFKQHIRDRKPVIYDVANFPVQSQQFMQRLGVKTLLGIPLLLGSEVVGSFTVRFTEIRQFQAEELELTQALAHQATLAIQLTRLSAIAQHETQQAAILGERNRMARELHDTLAQTFTGIVMQLEATQAMISSTTSEPAQKHLHRAGLLARQGLQEARRSVWSLRSEALESADLPTALLRIAQHMTEHTPIQTDVIVDGTPIALPAKLENHLLRIGQEALTNALKHTQPQRIQISLRFATDAVQLKIMDDGQGFDPQQQWRGFGITCMQERTHQSGGEFTLKSQIGQGTTIHVTIPLAPSEAGTL